LINLVIFELFYGYTLLYNRKFLITAGITENPETPPGQGTDKELIDWLQLQGADANTIKKVNIIKIIPILFKSCLSLTC
jgi:hypothetical protein